MAKEADKNVVDTTETQDGGVVVETTTRVKPQGGAGKKGANNKKDKKKSTSKKKSTKKTKKQIVWWPWILTGGMIASAVILCLCGRCRDKKSGCHERAKTEVVIPCDSCGGTTFIENYYDYGDHVQAEDHSQVTYSKQVVKDSQNVNQTNSTSAANHSRVNTCPKTVKPCPKEKVIVYDTLHVEERPVDNVPPKKKEEPTNCTITITYEETEYLYVRGRCR